MATTIQVNESTLALLKKLRAELQAKSYEEAIVKIVIERAGKKSMAGRFGKYFRNYSTKKMVKELQGERRKSDRF